MALPFIPTPDGASGNADIATGLPTPSNLLAVVPTLLNEGIVRSIQAVYQFDVSGDGGGIFYLDLKNGMCIFFYCIQSNMSVKSIQGNL